MKQILFGALLASVLFSVQASAKDVVASSHCPMTGATGMGVVPPSKSR